MRQNHVYSDINSSLKVDSTGNFKVEYDADAVVQSVKNIFATISGERVRSRLGSSLLRYLFQPMTPDTADDIRAEIYRNIRQYEPRVRTLRVRVSEDIDGNLYRVTMNITIDRFTQPIRFQTNLRSMNQQQ